MQNEVQNMVGGQSMNLITIKAVRTAQAIDAYSRSYQPRETDQRSVVDRTTISQAALDAAKQAQSPQKISVVGYSSPPSEAAVQADEATNLTHFGTNPNSSIDIKI